MPLIYVDTCVFVAAFEAAGNESRLLRELFASFPSGRPCAITSELTIAELLAPTYRSGVMSIDERRHVYLPLFEDAEFVGLAPITRRVLYETVLLRSEYPQKLPDAIHIATAVVEHCRFFLSSDRDARRVPSTLTWVTPSEESFVIMKAALDA